MKRTILITVFLFSFVSIYCQKSRERIAFDIIEQFLKSDVYYSLDFKKEDIPEIKIFCFTEKIPINYKRFGLAENSLTGVKTEIMNFDGLGVSKENSNYLLFCSDLVNNVLMVEILFNRADYLIKPAKTAFESYKRYNGVMTYLFMFSDEGCLISIQKEQVSYQ